MGTNKTVGKEYTKEMKSLHLRKINTPSITDLKLRGVFIVIEGLDGSGKTTQIRLLGQRLINLGYSVISTKEPTDGLWGGKIKGVQKGEFTTDPLALGFAYLADRVDHIQKLNLQSKKYDFPIILSDRYELSFLAYQQEDTTMDLSWLLTTHKGLPRPDLTIFLDVPPNECFKRIQISRSSTPERFEKNPQQLENIRKKYLSTIEWMNRSTYKIVIIDGTKSIDNINNKITNVVYQVILKRESKNGKN
jgi:dTMP kinase